MYRRPALDPGPISGPLDLPRRRKQERCRGRPPCNAWPCAPLRSGLPDSRIRFWRLRNAHSRPSPRIGVRGRPRRSNLPSAPFVTPAPPLSPPRKPQPRFVTPAKAGAHSMHCVMICHVPHAVVVGLHFRSCISLLRRVPFRSLPCAPPPAWAPSGGGTLVARARRRAHVSRPFPPGLFSAPAIASLAQKSKKAAPEAAFSLPAFYYTFRPVNPSGGRNMKILLLSLLQNRRLDEISMLT